MRQLPTGTVTFLFTDIEGSTRLAYEHGDRFTELLVEHRRLLREAFARHDGVELDTEGDAFFVVFASAREAVAAAEEAQQALTGSEVKVRMGLHTGEAQVVEGTYVGLDVHRAARIAAAGHGGQVLLSEATKALVDPNVLRDLGEHRLKDLRAPERLYQLGTDVFPPLKGLHPTNLPVPATAFLGRERELSEVTALLARDEVRLLTLTGAGGTGKTRLALQAAAEIQGLYLDGVFWIGLAPLSDPQLVLAAIAQVLGAKSALAEHIGSKRLLLLLDNLEQLVECAPELAELLAGCPNLNLLCTSREPLHLTGEHEYQVPTLAQADAVALFTERALATRPDFSANGEIAEICRRLDQLPLAIELAAARVKALSLGQIVDRLEQRLPLLTGGARDLPERQRTLRAAIEWSYDLLAEEEQRLFARLAVFAGGSTLEAAEAICEADLDTLQSLVDKSLLRYSGERYWMLETIREFAAERLQASEEAATVRRSHASYFGRIASAHDRYWELGAAGGYREAVELLDAEQWNLRSALAQLPETDPEQTRHAATAFVWFLVHQRGNLVEGRTWIERVLSTARLSDKSWVRLMTMSGYLANMAGDYEVARETLDAALARARSLGSSALTARVLLNLGYFAAVRERYAEAREALEEALELAEAVEDADRAWGARQMLAVAHIRTGQVERGLALHEECVAQARRIGDQAFLAEVLFNFAEDLLSLGDVERSRLLLEESLPIAHELGWTLQRGATFGLLAVVAARRGDPVRSATMLGVSDRARTESGEARRANEARLVDSARAQAEAEIGRERVQSAWEEGCRMTLDDALAFALGQQAPRVTSHS